MEEGNVDNTDDDDGDDYDKMENLGDNVLGNGNDKDDGNYDAVADNAINRKENPSGKVDSDNKEEEFFEEEEGVTVTTTE